MGNIRDEGGVGWEEYAEKGRWEEPVLPLQIGMHPLAQSQGCDFVQTQRLSALEEDKDMLVGLEIGSSAVRGMLSQLSCLGVKQQTLPLRN